MKVLADLAAEGKSGDIGQHHVQNGEIQPLPAHTSEGFGARPALEDGEALAFQIYFHQVGNFRLVVHDENIGVHLAHLFPGNPAHLLIAIESGVT